MMLPTPQSESSVSDGFDHSGALNQSGPSIPSFSRPLLTGPVAGFSR